MAQRLTDTSKWDEDWFLELSPTLKCVVSYFDRHRDGAGIQTISFTKLWVIDKRMLTIDDLRALPASQYVFLSGNRIWDMGYLERELKRFGANKAHQNIANMALRELAGEELPERGRIILEKLQSYLKQFDGRTPDGPRTDSARSPDGVRAESNVREIEKKQNSSGGGVGEGPPAPDAAVDWVVVAEWIFNVCRKFPSKAEDHKAREMLGEDTWEFVLELGGAKKLDYFRERDPNDWEVKRLAKALARTDKFIIQPRRHQQHVQPEER